MNDIDIPDIDLGERGERFASFLERPDAYNSLAYPEDILEQYGTLALITYTTAVAYSFARISTTITRAITENRYAAALMLVLEAETRVVNWLDRALEYLPDWFYPDVSDQLADVLFAACEAMDAAKGNE